MSNSLVSVDDFHRHVEEASSILTQNGFRRAPQFEIETSTTAYVVYVGKNVAFKFVLDIRDQAIDLVVVRCRDGRLVERGQGGYSSSLFAHLVNYCGLRGRANLPALSSGMSKGDRMMSILVNLLEQPCASELLKDAFDALPENT